jgi:hypothetical protein
MANEITLSDNIDVITAEINSYKQIAGNAIFEIGKRLKHVRDEIFKDTMKTQKGEWRGFLRGIDFDVTTAKRFIKVYEEFGEVGDTWHRLSMRVLYEIATLPEEEREQTHEIPSTGESKTVDEMTVKELREVKKALKQTQAERDAERKERERLEKEVKVPNEAYERTQLTLLLL